MRTQILYSHCWKNHVRADGVPCTCILLAGHTEPHKWTPDRDISFSFPRFKPREIKKTTNETAAEEGREQG